MKCLVLLAGCGLGDGSCIEEVILTYTALDKYGCDYTPVAEDLSVPSVNHLTEQLAEKRNILLEAARIGRGHIKDIREIDFEEYGALIIPGGIGLLNNYRHSDAITACVTYFFSKKKQIEESRIEHALFEYARDLGITRARQDFVKGALTVRTQLECHD